MHKVTRMARLRYRFDNLMGRGTIALLFWLVVLSALLIIGIAAVDALTGVEVRDDGTHIPFSQLMWMSLLRTLDPGTIGNDTGNQYFLGSMFVVTLGGIFLVEHADRDSLERDEYQLEELRKGRSFVVETGHTIILGWSGSVISIIAELAHARITENKCIVILAPQDKIWIEDEIRMHLPHLTKTRVVIRTGDPLTVHDLGLVNPDAARAILIPAPDAPDPDAHVIKTVLALVNQPGRQAESYHIVAECTIPRTWRSRKWRAAVKRNLFWAAIYWRG